MRACTNNESNAPADSTTVISDVAGSTRDTDDEPRPVPELDKDAVFLLLKNRRRREVLRYLTAHSGEAPIGEVAEYIAAIENDTTVQQLNAQQRKRVYIGLYQCHLPMMDDYDVITFNRPRGLLQLTPNATQLEPYLDDAATETERWSDYLAITVFGGLLYLFGGLLVGLDSWFTTLTVVGLLVSVTVLAISEGRDDIVAAFHTSTPASVSRVLQTVVPYNPVDTPSVSDDAIADE